MSNSTQHLHRHCKRCTDCPLLRRQLKVLGARRAIRSQFPTGDPQRLGASDHGEVARLWCTCSTVTQRRAFVRITKLQNQHTKILWTAVTPQGCIPLDPRSVLDRSSALEVRKILTRNTNLTADCSGDKQCTALSYFTTQKSRGFLEHL